MSHPDPSASLCQTARSLFDQTRDAELCSLLAAIPATDFAALPQFVIETALSEACDARQVDQALRIYNGLRASGRRGTLPNRLIDLLHGTGQTAVAVAIVADWHAGTDLPAQFIQRANAYERLGKVAAAQQEYTLASQRFPKAPVPSQLKARLDLRFNDRAAALASLRLALDRSDDKPGWIRRALLALETGRIREQGIDLLVPAEVVSPGLIGRIALGQYESQECHFIRQDLAPQDRVLDVGAGLGLVALVAHQTCPGVVAAVVEANPQLIPVLQQNLAAHRCDARVIHGLAALQQGEADFYLATEFWASSRRPDEGAAARVRVPEHDLRQIITETGPTILTMDVEGAEAELLPALDLSGLRRLIVELHPEVYGPTRQYALVGGLLSQGFSLSDMPGWSRVFAFERLSAPL